MTGNDIVKHSPAPFTEPMDSVMLVESRVRDGPACLDIDITLQLHLLHRRTQVYASRNATARLTAPRNQEQSDTFDENSLRQAPSHNQERSL